MSDESFFSQTFANKWTVAPTDIWYLWKKNSKIKQLFFFPSDYCITKWFKWKTFLRKFYLFWTTLKKNTAWQGISQRWLSSEWKFLSPTLITVTKSWTEWHIIWPHFGMMELVFIFASVTQWTRQTWWLTEHGLLSIIHLEELSSTNFTIMI